jgi:23S rRNA pseudouridine2605 synthase
MPKKIIPVPSDFARPKPGAYQKKEDKPKKKSSQVSVKRPARVAPKSPNSSTSYKPKPFSPAKKPVQTNGKMPLNKYIAHCGICSRREAIDLIKKGLVSVGSVIEKEPGYKVQDGDIVKLDGKLIEPKEHYVYYLLNKPKNVITTTDDPEGRRTVMDLLKPLEGQRIFPVGRLDRNTTGLLLLTNDGDLTQRLSHPKHQVRKVYQVGLDKPLTKTDFEAIAGGLILEDGPVQVDAIAYTDLHDKRQIGIEIHSGRNRIVRRIFEHLKYEVKSLDRMMYAGLTKKNLPRGKFRALEPHEVVLLKHFKP